MGNRGGVIFCFSPSHSDLRRKPPLTVVQCWFTCFNFSFPTKFLTCVCKLICNVSHADVFKKNPKVPSTQVLRDKLEPRVNFQRPHVWISWFYKMGVRLNTSQAYPANLSWKKGEMHITSDGLVVFPLTTPTCKTQSLRHHLNITPTVPKQFAIQRTLRLKRQRGHFQPRGTFGRFVFSAGLQSPLTFGTQLQSKPSDSLTFQSPWNPEHFWGFYPHKHPRKKTSTTRNIHWQQT